MNKPIIISNKSVESIWKCPDCPETARITPDWHQDNGTPMCIECDVNMEYSHIELVPKHLPVEVAPKFEGFKPNPPVHLLLTMFGDVEPELSEPLKNYDAVLEKAKEHRENNDECTDGLYHVLLDHDTRKMSICSFAGRDLDEWGKDEDDE